jgi:hypothetical protein
MREIRQSGSEGGGTGTTGPPYPYHYSFVRAEKSSMPAFAGHDGDVDRAPLDAAMYRRLPYHRDAWSHRGCVRRRP